MVKIYGASDDIVIISGSTYKESSIDCYNKAVLIYFSDGTTIRVQYPKKDIAVWEIIVEEAGTAYKKLHVCNDEEEDIYSDIFEIDAEVELHEVVDRR